MQVNKRILILAGIFPPDIGGPAIYSQRLAQELTKRNIPVKVICYFSGHSPQISKEPFEVIRISKKLGIFRFLSYLWNVWRLAKDSDILYAQTLFSAGIPALLAGKILGKKVIVKITGDHAWERFNTGQSMEEFQNKKYGWRIEFIKKMQAHLLKRVSKVIAPSQYLKNIISNWGVAPDAIEVIYNAPVRFPDLSVSKEEAQEKIGIKGDIILSVGRLMPWKGFDVLVEIMPDLLKENPNLYLVIVGEGPEKEKLRGNRVKLVGKIPHNQIYWYFRAANLFVLNTGYEGLSHTILEAMQAGLPIITTDIGGNPELIENEENGILIDYNNKEQLKQAILRLSADQGLQEKFKQNSKDKLQMFTWQNIIDKILCL